MQFQHKFVYLFAKNTINKEGANNDIHIAGNLNARINLKTLFDADKMPR